MQHADQHIQWYQSEFQAFEQSLNGEKQTPVHALRREGFRRFAELGFPTTKQEEWRFTNIAPIAKTSFHPIVRGDQNGLTRIDLKPFIVEEAARLVFVDGIYSPDLSEVESLPPDTVIGSLRDALKSSLNLVQPYLATLATGGENGFTALNTAFMCDGAFISLPRGVVLDKPIQLLFMATNRPQSYAAQPRNVIVVGENARCTVIETYAGLAGNMYLTNAVTEMVLNEHAVVEHDKLQIEGTAAYHIGTTHLQLKAGSSYVSNVVTLGGAIARNTISALLDAEGIECTFNGLSLGAGTQVLDNHTSIDHAKPHCNSHELYKSILSGASKGIFNGKIFVRKDAQKTDAKQTNKTLLLSDDATMNAKPQLEIFADDVKCTHGATVGQLDEEQVFYLRSRGIDLASARDMLTYAFASDVVNRIAVEPLRRQVDQIIHARLDGGKKNI